MKVLACDGIHADGLAMLKDAGWQVQVSEPVKGQAQRLGALVASSLDRRVEDAARAALRSQPGIRHIEMP